MAHQLRYRKQEETTAEDNDEMMMIVEVKNSGSKKVPRSDLRVGTANIRSSKEKWKRRIATWNVKSLGVCGKLKNLKLEMERYKIDVLGISEIKWTGLGDFWSGDYRIIFNGDENKFAGVGIMVNKDFGHKIKSIIYFNERISEVIEMAKEKDNLIILGDWNALVGERTEPGVTGKFGFGTRNQRGDRLIEFCKERDMIITNTLFSQPKRRRYTWTMPEEGNRYQLDYILVKKRYRNQVKQSKSYPGADINSDHNLVIMETRLSLKKSTRNQETKKKWYVEKLKQEGTRKQFFEVVNRIIRIKPTESTEELDNYENTWKSFKEAITKMADKILGKTKNIPIKPWISTRLVELIETRRKYKKWKNRRG
ncbi:Endonuclease/exonuclease/phosphatase [Cinara cedri]|uniref:Endonuclease/exonuclease/phosphatase n=1 Tax=Cinara cedri TaxID=506608 RepID=A0A5E4N7M4_9HEMI|nr:Endonuclease/exonuclease/phosphatase [Cinara cedri]